jgi:capsular polysaccharide transport system ATP-binding protein
MIELIDATKYYSTKLGPHYVFRNVSLKLPEDINIGVIGPNGAGKSTLLRLLAGGDILSSGRILRTGSISWPMGLTAGLQRTLTGRENARFACRIYGMPSHKIKAQLDKIQEISGVGKFFDLSTDSYSAGMIQRVSFAISISLAFDYYIFDEISAGGDLAFSKMAQQMMQDRLKSSRFILASHNLNEIRKLCKAVILIRNGELTFYDDVDKAIKDYSTPIAQPTKAGAPEPGSEMKLEKLRQHYITLMQAEARLAKTVAGVVVPARKAEVERQLQNTRSMLQDVILQFRLAHRPLPKADETVGAAAVSPPGLAGIDPALVRRIALLRRQIEDLNAAETRQELNAQRAESKAKRKDFLDRLAVTRHRLGERLEELKLAEAAAEEKMRASPPKALPKAPLQTVAVRLPIAPRAAAATPGNSNVGTSQRKILPTQDTNRQ